MRQIGLSRAFNKARVSLFPDSLSGGGWCSRSLPRDVDLPMTSDGNRDSHGYACNFSSGGHVNEEGRGDDAGLLGIEAFPAQCGCAGPEVGTEVRVSEQSKIYRVAKR
jgi:hypothetical protein